jgi:hypothetical protein
LEFIKTSDDVLKTLQAYMFLLKDIHAVMFPSVPFIHYINEQINKYYQLQKQARFEEFQAFKREKYSKQRSTVTYQPIQKKGRFAPAQ